VRAFSSRSFPQSLRKPAAILRPLASQVHEIHPSHAFLDVIDGRAPGSRSNSDPDPMAYHPSSLENHAPQCEWHVSCTTVLRRMFRLVDNLGIPTALLHQDVKCAQYVSQGYNQLFPQQARSPMLMFSLAAVCRTLWALDFIVSSAIRWTYVRIVNPSGCPVI